MPRTARLIGILTAVALVALPPASAGAAGGIATIAAGGDAVVWQPQVGGYDRLVLTVSGPAGVVRQEFKPGVPPSFSLFDADGYAQPDGTYAWEIELVSSLDAAARAEVAAARATGDDTVGDRLRAAGALPADTLQSGFFSIVGGAAVVGGESEQEAGGGGMQSAGAGAMTPVSAADQVIPDDLIVQGSVCAGFDCVNGESFSFDTIRLKENNLRIAAVDTSVGSFPTQDWQLTFNDSASGGASKFSIETTNPNARVPFTITAGAPTNSMFVDSSGRLGLRTSTPVLDLHIKTGNTPAIRLEQDGTSGFTAQTWDVAGNEANFFVRDVTGGSRLSFRIRPGAPTSALDISADGDIGIGTASPDSTSNAAVHIKRTNSTEIAAILQTNGVTTRFRLVNDTAVTNGERTWSVAQRQNGTFAIIQDGSGGADEFSIANNGDILVNGAVVHASSRTVKRDIVPVEPADVLDRVLDLQVAEWSYDKADPGGRHLGPMAEDFWSQFRLGSDDKHIAFNDASGVALAAIQGLNERLEQKAGRLQAENDELRQRLAAIEATLAALTGRQVAPAESSAP